MNYLERCCGLDVEAICQEILNEDVRAAIRAGARTITIKDTTFQIAGHIITAAQDPALRPGRGPLRPSLEDFRAELEAEIDEAAS